MVNRLDGSSRVDLRESLLAEERPAKCCCTCTPCEKVGAIAKDYFNRALALSGAAMTTAGIVLAAEYGFDETTAKVILYTGCGILGLAYARVVESLPPKEPRRSIELNDVGEEQTPSQVSHPNEWVAWKNRLPGEFKAWRALSTAEKLAIPVNYIKGRGRLGWHYVLFFLNIRSGNAYYVGAPVAMITSGYWLYTLPILLQKKMASEVTEISSPEMAARHSWCRTTQSAMRSHSKYLAGLCLSITIFSLFSCNHRVARDTEEFLSNLPATLKIFATAMLSRPFGMFAGKVSHASYLHPYAVRIAIIVSNSVNNPGILAAAGLLMMNYLPGYLGHDQLIHLISAALLGFSLGENDYTFTHAPPTPSIVNRPQHNPSLEQPPKKIHLSNRIFHLIRNNSGTMVVFFSPLAPVFIDAVSSAEINPGYLVTLLPSILAYRVRAYFRGRALQQILDRWRFDCFILSEILQRSNLSSSSSVFNTVIQVVYIGAFNIFLGAYQGGIVDAQKRKILQGMTFEVAPAH